MTTNMPASDSAVGHCIKTHAVSFSRREKIVAMVAAFTLNMGSRNKTSALTLHYNDQDLQLLPSEQSNSWSGLWTSVAHGYSNQPSWRCYHGSNVADGRAMKRHIWAAMEAVSSLPATTVKRAGVVNAEVATTRRPAATGNENNALTQAWAIAV